MKLENEGLQLHWIQNLVQVLSYEFCEIFQNIHFANVCEGLPLKSKIFTGVSFRKILGFYYKRNRQPLYYKGTSSYISLKIPECVINFQSSWVVTSENTSIDKNMFKVNTIKEYFRNVIRMSL